jgi:hypothetical protein
VLLVLLNSYEEMGNETKMILKCPFFTSLVYTTLYSFVTGFDTAFVVVYGGAGCIASTLTMNRTIAPTSTMNRISSLDFLWGIAILDILLINIESFAYPNPLEKLWRTLTYKANKE